MIPLPPHANRRLAIAVMASVVVLLVAAPAGAQSNHALHREGWILAAAHTPGKQGSIWRTDLWIYSNAGYATLYFCESGKDNTAAVGHQVTAVGQSRVIYIEDVVDHFLSIGQGSWLGAIRYSAPTDIQVWARVYSISPDGTKSYGQLIEGIRSADMSPSWKDADGVQDMQYVYAAKHTADGRFRVNVGVVNPTALTCTYRVAIFSATKNDPSTGSFEPTVTVPPYSMVQLGDPFAAVDGGAWDDHVMQLLCDTSGGGGFLYASVVDNATNDAFFVRAVKDQFADAAKGLNATVHTSGWILAAAHTPGENGSIWRTDLWIVAHDPPSQGLLKLRFCRANQDNSATAWIEVPVSAGRFVYYFEDVVEHFLHVGSNGWLGAIEYWGAEGVQVWARVYSVSPDGTASYGQLVEGISTADMSLGSESPGFTGAVEIQNMFAARHTADNRYRVNVGLVNPTGTTATALAEMLSGDGAVRHGIQWVTLPPYSMTQLNDPFASVGGGEWSDKWIRVEATTSGTGAFGYVSVVDNATNDAFFVRGIKRIAYPAAQ